MPTDPYVNPDYKPPVGRYKWVPDRVPTGGDVPGPAYKPLTIERGQFRNDLPVVGGSGSLTITTGGEIYDTSGNELAVDHESINWPILAAFRPLSRPSSARGAAPTFPLILQSDGSNGWWWNAELDSAARLSVIKLSYSLTVELDDQTLLPYLSEEDQDKIAVYLENPTDPPDVDWSQYRFAKLIAMVGADEKEFPPIDTDGNTSELSLTDYQKTSVNKREVEIRFSEGRTSNLYPLISSVKISNRYPIESLKISLYKVMLFEANRVNIFADQLPCALLQYAYVVNFQFDPLQDTLIWPPTNSPNVPNFHVKIFSPDYPTSSPGFAHSFPLRFLIFSMPIFGLSPGDFTSIVGALNSLNNTTTYLTVFIGPMLGRRALRYSALAKPTITGGRVVALDQIDVHPLTQTIRLQWAKGKDGDAIPGDSSEWIEITNATYNVTNTNFRIDGPFVAPFLYFHSEAGVKEKEWYRTVQILSNGIESTSIPFRSMLYSERSVMGMQNTVFSASVATTRAEIIRRPVILSDSGNPSPLDILPLAVFASDNAIQDWNFSKGRWSVKVGVKSLDSAALAHTHLFVRFWFHPDDEPLTANNLTTYQSQTEVYFESSSTNTSLVRGNPSSLSQLVISPPLPDNYTLMEMSRYMDVLVGGNTSERYTPFAGKPSRLMIGFYAIASPSNTEAAAKLNGIPLNSPKIAVDIDPQYMSIETTALEIIEGFHAQRASRYDRSTYQSLGTPLVLTRNIIGGGKLSGDTNDYVSYSQKFRSRISTATPLTGSAFQGLIALQSGAVTDGLICLPYTEVSLTHDQSVSYSADFCTDGVSLAGGRIGGGSWKAIITINSGADTARISADYRLEAFLVTVDGTVTERVFRTDLVSPSGNTVTFEEDIQIPFLISGADTQAILRLTVYPYSRDGKVIDLEALKESLGADIPLGARLQHFELQSHTLSRLSVVQTDSLLGSPAFYEDLPLVPNRVYGSDEFIYKANPENLKITIVFSDLGWDISGCFYSPTWFTSIPQGAEVRVSGAPLGSSDLWVRTVLGEAGQLATEKSLSVSHDPVSGRLHLVHDNNSETSGEENSIQYYNFDSPYGASMEKSLVKGVDGNTMKNYQGNSASLCMIRTGLAPRSVSSSSPIISIISQVDTANGPILSGAMNVSGGQPRWHGPNRDLYDDNFGEDRKIAQGLSHPAYAQSPNSPMLYTAGWVEPGTIIVKETMLYDAGIGGGLAEGIHYVVDGDPDFVLTGQTASLSYNWESTGKALETFPAIVMNDTGHLTVAYSLEDQPGVVIARTSQRGAANFGPAYIAASLRASGSSASQEIAIYGPTMSWHQPTNTTYLAFWCGGKIFFTPLNGHGPSQMISPLQLVAGSRDLTANNNAANPFFQAVVAAGGLRIHQEGDIEEDVPAQRVAFTTYNRSPYQGDMFVYYFNAGNQPRMRRVIVGGKTGASVAIT